MESEKPIEFERRNYKASVKHKLKFPVSRRNLNKIVFKLYIGNNLDEIKELPNVQNIWKHTRNSNEI